jgi:phenylalanyl-tRNA synthetase beta chain
LIGAARANLHHAETGIVGFAVGKVFWMAERPAEARRVAAVLCGLQPKLGLGPRPRLEFLDAKGALESLLASLRILDRVTWRRVGEGQVAFHPGKSALAVVDGCVIAIVGVLHPEAEAEFALTQPCCLFELDLERALEYLPARPVFEDLPRFPAVVRDVAVIAGADFASERIILFIRQWNRQLVDRVELFDQYTGSPVPEGKKSLAYSISYRAADRTLTDSEVNELHQQLLSDMSTALPIEFRH